MQAPTRFGLPAVRRSPADEHRSQAAPAQQMHVQVIHFLAAIVAAWLPGSDGLGMTDVLCGGYPFTGRLPHAWIASMDQLPAAALSRNGAAPSYPYGFGLT